MLRCTHGSFQTTIFGLTTNYTLDILWEWYLCQPQLPILIYTSFWNPHIVVSIYWIYYLIYRNLPKKYSLTMLSKHRDAPCAKGASFSIWNLIEDGICYEVPLTYLGWYFTNPSKQYHEKTLKSKRKIEILWQGATIHNTYMDHS